MTAPEVAAVGFTGSTVVGRELFDLAAARAVPIPVYAEMGSVNPVVLAPSAVDTEEMEATVKALAASVTTGWGQFCTKPGVVVVPGHVTERVTALLTDALAVVEPGHLLSGGIHDAFERGVGGLARIAGVRVWRGVARDDGFGCSATVLATDAPTFLAERLLRDEVFGPAVLVVGVSDLAQLDDVLAAVGGSLTGTVHGRTNDAWVQRAVDRFASQAGRIVVGGVPTGVAVDAAMHHGGPYPASTIPWSTSVGSAAVRRFLRPVAYQDTPEELLPPGLKDANPWRIERTVDGRFVRSGE